MFSFFSLSILPVEAGFSVIAHTCTSVYNLIVIVLPVAVDNTVLTENMALPEIVKIFEGDSPSFA